MKYTEILSKYQNQQFGEINIKRDIDFYILNGDKYNEDNVIDNGWEIFLNHSCDNWVIGNITETEKFYQDLEKTLKYCRNNP